MVWIFCISWFVHYSWFLLNHAALTVEVIPLPFVICGPCLILKHGNFIAGFVSIDNAATTVISQLKWNGLKLHRNNLIFSSDFVFSTQNPKTVV